MIRDTEQTQIAETNFINIKKSKRMGECMMGGKKMLEQQFLLLDQYVCRVCIALAKNSIFLKLFDILDFIYSFTKKEERKICISTDPYVWPSEILVNYIVVFTVNK